MTFWPRSTLISVSNSLKLCRCPLKCSQFYWPCLFYSRSMHPFGNFALSCRQPFILCIPSVNTESYCKHSFSQHTTSRSDHHAFQQSTLPHGGQIKSFHQSTQHHVVVRSSCIPPVGLVPHGGQIIMHFTSQHCTTWWSDHQPFHQSTQHHVAVIPPVSTVPHGGQIESFHPSTQYHLVVRVPGIPPVSTVPHGGQIITHSTSQHSTCLLYTSPSPRDGLKSRMPSSA